MDGKTYTRNNEGCRLVSYKDTRGFWTIGVGHMLGRGPEFDGVEWTQTQVNEQYDKDYLHAQNGATFDVGAVCWSRLDEIRQAALTDMAFNIGEEGLGEFHHMIASVLQNDWNTAASELLSSDYANQVPNRAKKNASILATGEWPDNA